MGGGRHERGFAAWERAGDSRAPPDFAVEPLDGVVRADALLDQRGRSCEGCRDVSLLTNLFGICGKVWNRFRCPDSRAISNLSSYLLRTVSCLTEFCVEEAELVDIPSISAGCN